MKIGDCVGRWIFVFVLFFFGSIGAKGQLYVEDFSGEANGAQTGTAAGTPGGTWSTTAASVHRQNVAIAGEILLAENTGAEQRWETNSINISTAGYAIISTDVWSALVEADDYLRLYYKVDGGPEILFYELEGGNPGVDAEPATPASAIVSGSTLQVVARFRNNTRTIIFFPLNSLYGLDNVTVTAATVLYSRKGGLWTDVAGGFGGTGTWSTNRSGTPACGCVPLNSVVAVIQNGHTVTLPISQIAVGASGTPNLAPGAVDVESGGILQYNVSGVTLGIQQGLMRVRSGGTINSSSGLIAGEQVSFNADLGGATLQVDAGGTMSIEDLVLGTNATNLHYLSGSGTLTITDDILIDASGATLTNNRSASFTVSGDVDFNGANSSFVNNAAMTISGDILMDATNNSFTNNGSLTVSDDVDYNAANSSFVNNAAMTISDDILMDADNSSFTNNTSSLTITDDLNFNSLNSAFTNNAIASIGDIVVTDANDDDNFVANSSGATLTLGGVIANGGDLDILNSGTINQSGNFTNISNADTNLDNLATGIWNWTLTPNTTFDADMNTVLNCTAAGNIFNYSGTGAQSIIAATYYHLTLSNSGDKLTSAALDVNGNLLIQNTAVLSSVAHAIDVEGNIDILNTAVLGNGTSSGSINIGGNWAAVNAASFVQGSRTVDFDRAGAQTITNSSGTETFGNLTLSGSGIKSSSNLIDIDGNLSIAGTAQFSVSNDINLFGNWAVTSTNADPFVEGTYTVSLDGAAQAISTPLAAGETFYHLTVSGSGIKSTSDILTVSGNLLISGGRLTMNNNNLSVAGNWTVSSSDTDPFVPGSNTVFLNGGNAQTLITSQTGGETFNNLTINNTSGTPPQITFSDNVNVTTTLTMTDGIVRTDASNLLIMLNGSTTTIGSAASYVDGPIQYNMAANNSTTTLNFPIGKNGNYGAVSLRVRHNAATSFSYTAEVIGSSARALNYSLASGTDRVSGLRYWDIKRGLTASPTVTNNNNLVTTGATQAPRLTIYYVALDEVTQPSNLTVVKNVNGGSSWVNIGATASGTPTGSVTTTAPSANFVSFSYFTLANLTGGTNPLPIDLLSFAAAIENSEVELKWSTASETNNDYFTIERATDVEHFEPIVEVAGQGTSKELNHYNVVDSSPLYGRSYYRLKQTDFDGKFTYSDLRTIDYEGPLFATLTAFPNPLEGSELSIRIAGLRTAEDVRVEILNMQGKKVFDKIIQISAPGTVTENISNLFLPPGLYIIKAGETKFLTQKIIIK